MLNSFIALLLALVAEFPAVQEPPSTRAEFRDRAATIVGSTTKDTVRALLGPPGAVRTPESRSWNEEICIAEVWSYGVSGSEAFGTLGEVGFGDDDRALWVSGSHGDPGSLPAEEVLRPLLAKVNRVGPLFFGADYNPSFVIDAVNALLPLGKDQALRVLDEYERIRARVMVDDADLRGVSFEGDAREATWAVMLAMFKPVVGQSMPPFHLPWGNLRQVYPHYPIVVTGDVPYFLFPLGDWGIGGDMPRGDEDRAHFAAVGQVRERPLTPPDNPAGLVEAFFAAPEWTRALALPGITPSTQESAFRAMAAQTLALLDDVYRPAERVEAAIPRWGADHRSLDAPWNEHAAAIAEAGVRWSPARCRYERADGTILPPRPPLPPRQVWRIDTPGRLVQVVAARTSSETVDICVLGSAKEEAPALEPRTLLVERVDNQGLPAAGLTSLDYPVAAGSFSSQNRSGVRLASGARVRITLIDAGGAAPLAVSPVWTP